MLKSKIIYLNVTKLYSSSYCRFASTSSSQDHYQILGVSRNATIEQIKSAYRELSKKHHPDVSQDPSSVELFKKISNAYSVLKDEKSRSNYDYGNSTSYDQPGSKTYQYSAKKSQSSQSSQSYSESSDSGASRARDSGVKSEEEALYESIFGKTFKEDPLFFYKAENEELRKKYHEALDKLKEKKGTKSQESSGAGASTASHEFYEESEEWRQFMRDYIRKRQGSYTAEETYNGMNREAFKRSPLPSWAKAFLALGSGVIIYFLTVERGKITAKYETTSAKGITNEGIDVARGDYLKKKEDAKEKKKSDFLSSLALMKKYPRRNPTATNMLVDYTVWNDVKIYHVPCGYFHGEEEELTHNTYDFEKSRIYNTKMNTKLTLALETERIYKNVYVKVDDVLESLKKKGFYEPPGIFFRYYGYIYTRIRRKPIIAENLKESLQNGDKTISLFDLFFKYTTPILIANDEYYEIPLHHTAYIPDTTTTEGKSWIGNAHVNHRPIDKKVVSADEKNIFMWKGTFPPNFSSEQYLRAWAKHYDEYKKI